MIASYRKKSCPISPEDDADETDIKKAVASRNRFTGLRMVQFGRQRGATGHILALHLIHMWHDHVGIVKFCQFEYSNLSETTRVRSTESFPSSTIRTRIRMKNPRGLLKFAALLHTVLGFSARCPASSPKEIR